MLGQHSLGVAATAGQAFTTGPPTEPVDTDEPTGDRSPSPTRIIDKKVT
jgi:hypothetical protein